MKSCNKYFVNLIILRLTLWTKVPWDLGIFNCKWFRKWDLPGIFVWEKSQITCWGPSYKLSSYRMFVCIDYFWNHKFVDGCPGHDSSCLVEVGLLCVTGTPRAMSVGTYNFWWGHPHWTGQRLESKGSVTYPSPRLLGLP